MTLVRVLVNDLVVRPIPSSPRRVPRNRQALYRRGRREDVCRPRGGLAAAAPARAVRGETANARMSAGKDFDSPSSPRRRFERAAVAARPRSSGDVIPSAPPQAIHCERLSLVRKLVPLGSFLPFLRGRAPFVLREPRRGAPHTEKQTRIYVKRLLPAIRETRGIKGLRAFHRRRLQPTTPARPAGWRRGPASTSRAARVLPGFLARRIVAFSEREMLRTFNCGSA